MAITSTGERWKIALRTAVTNAGGTPLSQGTENEAQYIATLLEQLATLIGSGTVAAHATQHQNGGSDEVATATAAANAIPKAGSGGTLDAGWTPAYTGEVTKPAGSATMTVNVPVTAFVTVYDGTFATGTSQPAVMTDASMTGRAAGGNENGTLGVVAGSFSSSGAEVGTSAGQGALGAAAAADRPYAAASFPAGRVPVALFKANGQEPQLLDMLSTANVSYPLSINQPVYAYAAYRSDASANQKWRLWYYFRDASTGLETPFTPNASLTSVSVLVPQTVLLGTQTQAQRRQVPVFSGQAAEVEAATTASKGIVELAIDGEVGANVAVQGNDSRLDAITHALVFG